MPAGRCHIWRGQWNSGDDSVSLFATGALEWRPAKPGEKKMQGKRAGPVSPKKVVAHGAALMLTSMLFLAAGTSQATEPMRDILQIGERSGRFIPEECCWVDLPRTERLRAAKRAQACSAIGGPVGQFELRDEEVWLVGLRVCGGEMPLDEIYPEMTGPTPATWLNGRFRVDLDRLCFKWASTMPVFGTTKHFDIKQGKVVRVETETRDATECQPPAGHAGIRG